MWLEELQHDVDIRQYDMAEAQLTKAGMLLALEVGCVAALWLGTQRGYACLAGWGFGLVSLVSLCVWRAGGRAGSTMSYS